MTLIVLIIMTLAAVVALVLFDFARVRLGRYIAKPLASSGFLAVAVLSGALEAPGAYASWILAGLVLSFLGDVLLMPDDQPKVFLAGLGSFLLGHVAYVGAFWSLGLALPAAALAAVVLIPLAWGVWRWLRPHLPADMVVPVLAYVLVISCMELSAIAASVQAADPVPAIGATLFFASDLAVARSRFVHESPWNGAWGLPLYYGGQLLLALSIARPLLAG